MYVGNILLCCMIAKIMYITAVENQKSSTLSLAHTHSFQTSH
uniref:Uncharacterized protein n=1 Tax=Rhizophora mucronata TaxID=61149 RepID=A0A2P2Q6W7_RHIMU